jgi:hypothetical protein
MKLEYNNEARTFSISEQRDFSLRDRLKFMRKSPMIKMRALVHEYRKLAGQVKPEDKDNLVRLLTNDLQAAMLEVAPLITSLPLAKVLGLSQIAPELNAKAMELTIAYRKALTKNPQAINKFINVYSEFVSSLVNSIIK